jgi:hypothetical protein
MFRISDIVLLTGRPFEGEEDEGRPTSYVCDNEGDHHLIAPNFDSGFTHLFSPFYPYNITPKRVEVKV